MFTGLRSQDQLQLDGGYLGGQMEWKLNHGSLLSCMHGSIPGTHMDYK